VTERYICIFTCVCGRESGREEVLQMLCDHNVSIVSTRLHVGQIERNTYIYIYVCRWERAAVRKCSKCSAVKALASSLQVCMCDREIYVYLHVFVGECAAMLNCCQCS